MSASINFYGIKRLRSLLFAFIFFLFNIGSYASIKKNVETNPLLSGSESLISFQENKGQLLDNMGGLANNVWYKGQYNGLEVYLTNSGISYVHRAYQYEENHDTVNSRVSDINKVVGEHVYRLDLRLEGMNANAKHIGKRSNDFYTNYFLSHSPQGIYNVKEYSEVEYEEVWKNINWKVYNTSGGMKHEFILEEGAQLKDVKLRIDGAKNISLSKGGLKIETPYGVIEEKNLYCYVISAKGERQQVKAKYVLIDDLVTFDVDWNGKGTLVIDPHLVWGTYYTSTSGANDFSYSITTDKFGNVFMTGNVVAAGFPLQNPGGTIYYQGILAGIEDAFILKFDNNGVRQWATLYGGSSSEVGYSVITDLNGDLYVTGQTNSSNFPFANPGGTTFFQGALSGVNYDAFLLKFDNAGNRLWATFYGGSGIDAGMSVAIDALGNLYMGGNTNSPAASFPLLNGGGASYNQGVFGGSMDGFIAKFSITGQQLWSTFYGGTGTDLIMSLATDGTNNLVVLGSTTGNFLLFNPGGVAYYDGIVGGTSDAFILKFSSAGQRLWSTYYGGSSTEAPYSIDGDVNGNIFVISGTDSGDLPTYDPGGGVFYQSAINASSDLFILKFDNTLQRQWATYIGGNGQDYNATNDHSIAVDDIRGYVAATFVVYSTDMPIYCSQSLYSNVTDNDESGYLIVFDNAGVPLWSTYIDTLAVGTNHAEEPYNVAIDPSGNFFLSTYTKISGGELQVYGPLAASYVQHPPPSVSYGNWFAKFSYKPSAGADKFICVGSNIQLNVSGGDYYTWTPSAGLSCTDCPNPLASPIVTTTYVIASGCIPSGDTIVVNVNPTPIASVTSDTSICAGRNVTLTAGNGPLYFWSNGATTAFITVSPASPTSFSVIVSGGPGCDDTAYVNVNVNPPLNVSISSNSSICSGDSVLVSATSGAAMYSWSNGNTTSSFMTHPAVGNITYSLVVSNGFCADTLQTTINVAQMPIANAGNDDTICRGQNLTLNGTGGSNYLWSTGSTSASITISPIITIPYTLTVSNGACSDVDLVNIVVVSPPSVIANSNTTIIIGASVTISAVSVGGINFQWSPSSGLSCVNCAYPVASPIITTTYFVTTTDINGCTATDSVIIIVDVKCGEVFIPNAFSPNGDAENDVFFVLANTTCVKEFLFRIYDRWGEIVFETTDIKSGWDGFFRDKKLNAAVFAYQLNMVSVDNTTIARSGNITLVR